MYSFYFLIKFSTLLNVLSNLYVPLIGLEKEITIPFYVGKYLIIDRVTFGLYLCKV